LNSHTPTHSCGASMRPQPMHCHAFTFSTAIPPPVVPRVSASLIMPP
jgi:hypothetical protein